jgi:hydroxymethylglutaryl-CoA lyase
VRYFDSSFGGVGGNPAKVKYGGGFIGNVCTEDLVNLFESMGIATGIDLEGCSPRPRAALSHRVLARARVIRIMAVGERRTVYEELAKRGRSARND